MTDFAAAVATVLARGPEPAVAWVTGSARERFAALDLAPVVETGTLPGDAATLVAVGGGTLIDRAKAATRGDRRLALVAVPTLWGSGAEASPVIVLEDEDGTKRPQTDPANVPDAAVPWDDLADAAPEALRRAGSADVWAHALEAFVSPLGNDDVRREAGEVLRAITEADPLGPAERWFAWSAAASRAQGRSGVGLAHGVAHVLEPRLRATAGPDAPGHARLIAAALPPVFALLAAEAPRWRDGAEAAGLDAGAIATAIAALPDPADVALVRDALPDAWPLVLRDPCTRMGGFTTRRGHLDDLIAQPA